MLLMQYIMRTIKKKGKKIPFFLGQFKIISYLYITKQLKIRIMEYKMKKICNSKYPSNAVLKETYLTIMSYIKGKGNMFAMTERCRQYFTWGANAFKYIASEDGCYGIQFKVSGMLHRGRVRIYYNPASDYFDIELLRAIKDEMVWGADDIDFIQLHNILHQHIERTDDEEV